MSFAEAGRLGIFIPMYFVLARKPEQQAVRGRYRARFSAVRVKSPMSRSVPNS